jgi:hypothetical protein
MTGLFYDCPVGACTNPVVDPANRATNAEPSSAT